jgi:hypothetical protein
VRITVGTMKHTSLLLKAIDETMAKISAHSAKEQVAR